MSPRSGWAAPIAENQKPAAPVRFEEDVKPILAQYCYGCHGEKKKKGDLSLEAFANESLVKKAPDVWEKVMKNVSTREMPPEQKPQPTVEQRNIIMAWITENLFPCDCERPDPGRVTIHRLNRVEYNNTIRDLIGVDFQPAADFPSDDVGYGFDNIGDVLSMPTILLEKYLAAAEKILNDAVVTEVNTGPKTLDFKAADLDGTAPGVALNGGARLLRKAGNIYATVKFPKDGEYVLRASAYGEQSGPDPARMAFILDGETVSTFDVANEKRNPRDFEIKLHAKPGLHRFAAAFINEYANENEKSLQKRDRKLVIDHLEVDGPYHAGAELPETHNRIFFPRRSGESNVEYGRDVIARFAARAYRRPVTPDEIERLMRFVLFASRQGDSFEKGVQLALETVLISPNFLFRGEINRPSQTLNRIRHLNDFELASRLSYFLWSSMPDAALFESARLGVLHQRRELEQQVQRMLRDPKSAALVENFGGQWLQIRNLSRIAPDKRQFPKFNESLRDAMRTETEMFLGAILREDRSILDMLDADYTFVNAPLARLYGIEGVQGDEFQRVTLNSKERGGLLTQASILTVTSNPTRTSPVKRGRWVLDNILGTPPPPPPPDVPPLKESSGDFANESLRQRMEKHRENASCASCHARMDPLGFGLENFDGIGAWRSKDGKFAIDASGILPDGCSFSGPVELKRILLARKEDFSRCLTEKMLTYALGRGLEYYDKCAVESICRELQNDDYRFSRLIAGIVESIPFQMRKGESEQNGTQVAVK